MENYKENSRTAHNRKMLKEKGICGKCWRGKIDGNTGSCKECKAKYKNRKTEAVSNGLCSRCLKNPLSSTHCCEKCLIKERVRRKITKDKVFQVYGGYKCACCGELEEDFLTIDHTENNGNLLRKEQKQGSGGPFYKWLIRNNFPRGYQVLCMNCQIGKAKSKLGICPHKLTLEQRTLLYEESKIQSNTAFSLESIANK